MKINPATKANPKTASVRKPMTIILSALLGIVFFASLAFLLLLFKVSLEDADFWLRPMTAVVLFFAFASGVAAAATGYFAGEKMAKEVADARREQAEAERRLREAFSPREIADQRVMIESLKQFEGMKFVLVSLTDVEIVRTAEQIYAVLGDARWQLVRGEKTTDGSRFMDGILVQTSLEDRRADEAADMLVAQLINNKIQAARVPYNEIDVRLYGLSPDAVLVKVGFKPSPLRSNETEERKGDIRMRGNRRAF